MCKAHNWETNETHVYSVLAKLDSDLEGMFPFYDYETDKSSKNKRGKKDMKTKKATSKTKAKKTTKKATSRAKTPLKTKAALKGKQRPKN